MSETNNSLSNIPTFVTLPVNTFDNPIYKPEQYRIIRNAIIKTLSDGSMCIIDANDFNSHQDQHSASNVTFTLEQVLQNNNVEKPESEQNQVPIQKPQSSQYKCPKCKEVFSKVAIYRKHMMWHRTTKKFRCEQCSASYNVETNLKIHMAMHEEGKPTCPLCKISFQRVASLKSHLMLHQVEELYTCEECAAEFEKEEELMKHFKVHLNTVPENDNLICTYCNVQFDDHKKYKEHISHHIKIKKMVLSGKRTRKTHRNKEYPHACSVCLKSFPRVSLLERHLRVHSGERPFVCPHCNRGFNQKGTLQIHLSKHTGIKPFQCALCSARFNQKGNLRVHVEKTHTAPVPGVKTYKCSHCTCIFKKIASLNVHITKSHESSEDMGGISNVMSRLKELEEQTSITANMKPIEKEIAEQNKKVLNEIKEGNTGFRTSYVRLAESFLDGTVRRYLIMQKKVNDVRWYICSYCSKEFKKPSDLIRHTRIHTREKPFVCKQCGASFSLKSTLFCHVKTHIGNNSYYCVICLKKFSSVRSVNLHLRKHSEKQSQQYKCVTCNKRFSSIHKAKLHIKEIHTNRSERESIQVVMKQPLLHTPNGLLPVSPPKIFASKTALGTKQFQCQICNLKFSKMPNLNRHMLLHSGEKKFKCDQCMKSYCTSHALKEHLLHHTGIKNYGCKVCGKKYMTASLLKRHTISHSTHKPYVCPYCNKNFKSVMLCRKHMNIHKKEINMQIHIQNETGEKKSSEPDKSNLIDFSNSNINSDVFFTQTKPNSSSIKEDQVPVTNTLIISSEAEKSSQVEKVQSQLMPNSIQIIANSDGEAVQDVNQVQTIFINCEDLQLGDNLYSQNTDAMFFGSLNDLQDGGVFSIDPLNESFDAQNTETYNVSDILTNVKMNSVTSPSKQKNDKPNSVLNDNILGNNIQYYPNSELNLLFNLDSEFETTNNLNLPDININEVPLLNVEAPQENVEGNFCCDKCRKVFQNKNIYTKHVNAHITTKKIGMALHQCSFCIKAFKKQSDLIRHIRTHTGEKPFACDKCEKKFGLKSTLLSHQRTHNPVSHKRYNCVVCNSFFTSKSSLKVHMTVHTGDKTHECGYCPMTFRTAAHRKSHETNHHINPSKKKTKNKVTNLLASVAMEAINQQDQQLKNDQLLSVDDTQNVLIVQEQFPADQGNILGETSQMVESAQLEPLILQQLQSNFSLQESFIPASSLIQLDDGTLLDVGKAYEELNETVDVSVPTEKPRNLECDVCHKKYASKDVLRKHKKIHGINKKFPCSKCDKGFDVEEDLEKHERSHVGYRPYSCMYCTNSFSKEHSLTTHMKRLHAISLKDNLFA